MTKIDIANRDLDVEFNYDTPAEFEKIKCVKNMKNLLSKNNLPKLRINYIENYKYIVETQDGLLNKAIMKQNNIRNPEELAGTNSRFKLLDDKEYIYFLKMLKKSRLEKVKQFLQEQKRYLEEKNGEIVV